MLEPEISMHKPAVALLNITYDCNNRCRWCYASPMGFAKEMMPVGDAKRYLDLSKSLGITDVGLLGGEPTLHPGLVEIIRYAASIGIKICLYTNARRLSDAAYAKRLKEAGVYMVQADISSSDPKKYDWGTRVKGSYDEAVRGIENCHEQKLELRILSVLCSADFSNYRRLIDRFAPIASQFVFFREIPVITKLSEQKILSNAKTAGIIGKLYSYSKKRGIDASFYFSSPLCWFRKSFAEMMIKDGVLENYCHVLDGRCLSIDIDGRTIPCVHWPGYHMMPLKEGGLVLSADDFMRKWNSARLNGIRETLRRYPSRECARCSYYGTNCRGGCPLVKFELGPYVREYSMG